MKNYPQSHIFLAYVSGKVQNSKDVDLIYENLASINSTYKVFDISETDRSH